MKKVLIFLLLSISSYATVSVTGDLRDPSTAFVASRTFVRFWIRGCGGNQPRVTGTATIVPMFQDFSPNASGTFSGTLYDSLTEISCGGVTGGTWYGVVIYRDGRPGPETPYNVTGASFNLNSASPITVMPIASPRGYEDITEISAPSNPTTGLQRLYAASSDHTLKCLTSSGASCFPASGGGSGTPGGGDTQVQINDGGVFFGNSGLTYNKSTQTLTATHITGQDNRPYIDVKRDCGLVGNGVTDDSAALATCMATYLTARLYFPPTNFANNCSYYFGSSITPPVGSPAMTFSGASNSFLNSTTQLGGTVLCFPAGVTGFTLQNCGCTIEYISILGSEGTQHLQNPSLLNIPSNTNLPLFTRSILTIQRAANVLTVNTSRVVNIEGLTQQVGSTVKISGVVGDATMNGLCVVATLVAGGGTATNPTQFTCAQNGSDTGPFGAVGTVSLPTTGASAADGIRVCNNHTFINHVSIQGFGRHGINADSFGGHGCTVAFSDDLILRDSFINDNQANGYLCYGVDCNAHLLEGNEIYYNVMWGIEDQSSLGNTHVGNQISNNSHFWAGTGTPATKNITSVTRTSGTVAVVLATANPFIKLGTCVFNAGVTDATFNTTAGQCFFVTSFTDSTHFSYIQPGAPGDASSSGGTNRISTFAEAYLSSGVDDGAQKIETQSAVAQPVIVNQYVEGGQICKWGPNTILIGGANTPACAQGVSDWIGKFITTQGCTGGGGTLCANLGLIANNTDAAIGLTFKGGATADQDVNLAFNNHSNGQAWLWSMNTSGTLGSTSSSQYSRGGVRRFGFWGPGTSSGITRINSESTGAVQINVDSNSGTGGLLICSGGASPSCPANIDSTGKATVVKIANSSYQDVTEIAAPSNPSAGINRLYADSTSHTLKCLTSSGGDCNPGGSGAGTVTNTGTLTASALMVGNGGVDSKVLASLGTTTTLLHGNAAGLPTFGAVSLTADVSGNLPVGNLNSGTSASSSTFWRGDGTWAAPAGAGTINSGVTNIIPKYTAATTIDDSLLSDDATTLTYTGTGGLSVAGPIVSTAAAGASGSAEYGSGSATTASWVWNHSGDAASNGEPGYFKASGSPADAYNSFLFPCSAAGNWCKSSATPAADSSDTIAALSDVQASSGIYAVDSVGTDAYAIIVSPAIGAYADGQRFCFKAGTANTGNATLAVSGLTAKNILKNFNATLANNDILAGQRVCVMYDLANTTWQMVSPIANVASSGADTALSNLASVAVASPLLPASAAGVDFGSATKPWKDLFFAGTSGTPGTNNFKITGASTSGTRVLTVADGASVSVVADAGAANNFLTGITTAGAITKAQVAFTNLSGSASATQAAAAVMTGGCDGTSTSSATIAVTGLGAAGTGTGAWACTNSPAYLEIPMGSAGTIKNLFVKVNAAGVNASSGVFTVFLNGSGQTLTCTVGTGTTCNDTTHTFTVAAGDSIGVKYTTQAAETLARVRVSIEKGP